MHIAIDIQASHEANAVRGIGSYVSNLKEALERYETSNTYTLVTRIQDVPKKTDLVHYPYFDPFFLTLPIVKRNTTVVTVHDLIPIRYSDHFTAGIRGSIKWHIQRISLSGVRRIITDSAASKEDIADLTGFPEDRIHAVYLAPYEGYKPDTTKTRLLEVSAKYHIPSKYFLYVGDVNWNKNIPGLLEGYRKTRDELQGYGLVLVGKSFTDSGLRETRQLDRLIDEMKLAKSIVKTGYIPSEDLRVLYTNASVYVQPSFAEGFGFPVLEAMSCGCPVVAAKSPGLSEIAGPATPVNPFKPDDIAGGMIRTVKADRSILTHEAREWAKTFTWKRVARETVAVYEKAIV